MKVLETICGVSMPHVLVQKIKIKLIGVVMGFICVFGFDFWRWRSQSIAKEQKQTNFTFHTDNRTAILAFCSPATGDSRHSWISSNRMWPSWSTISAATPPRWSNSRCSLSSRAAIGIISFRTTRAHLAPNFRRQFPRSRVYDCVERSTIAEIRDDPMSVPQWNLLKKSTHF